MRISCASCSGSWGSRITWISPRRGRRHHALDHEACGGYTSGHNLQRSAGDASSHPGPPARRPGAGQRHPVAVQAKKSPTLRAGEKKRAACHCQSATAGFLGFVAVEGSHRRGPWIRPRRGEPLPQAPRRCGRRMRRGGRRFSTSRLFSAREQSWRCRRRGSTCGRRGGEKAGARGKGRSRREGGWRLGKIG